MRRRDWIYCIILLIIILGISLYLALSKKRQKKNPQKYETYISECQNKFKHFITSFHPTKPPEEWEKYTTIAIKTLNRPECVLRLLDTIRKRYHHVPIVIVDDSRDPLIKDGEQNNITYKHLPFDVGVSIGRNKCIEMTKTKYFLLLDDDFELTDKSDMNFFYRFLERHHNFDLICGALDDRGLYSAIFQKDGNRVIIKENPKNPKGQNKIIQQVENGVFETHRGLNFFMTRTSFIRKVNWDPILKTEEHTEHFFRMFLFGGKIAITDKVEVHHDGGKGCDRNDIINYETYRQRGMYMDYICMKHKILQFGSQKITQKQLDFNIVLTHLYECLTVPFHLTCGTALGFHREFSFIEHDTDIDIFINKDDFSHEKISSEMRKYFYLYMIVGEPGLKLVYKHRELGIKVDICVLYSHRHFLWYIGDSTRKKWKLPFYKPDKKHIFFHHYDILPEWVLQYIYGTNWKTPVKYEGKDLSNGIPWIQGKFENDGPVPTENPNFVNQFFGTSIYVINLDRRPDRMVKVNNVLQKLGIRYNRFSAIDAKTSSLVKSIKESSLLTLGEIACTLSHQEIWKQAVQNKAPWTLVFEDDLLIPESVNQLTFSKVMKEATYAGRNPQIVYFGHCFNEGNIELPNLFKQEVYLKTASPCCTHCYAITWRGAEHLLKVSNQFKDPVDIVMKNLLCAGSEESRCLAVYRIGEKPLGSYGDGIVYQHSFSDSDVKPRNDRILKMKLKRSTR